MTEAQFMTAVRQLAGLRGYLTYHTHRSDRSEPGFPDLVLVHPGSGHLVFAELKAAKGRVSAAQHVWIDALRRAGQNAYIWYPADLSGGVIARTLNGPLLPVAQLPAVTR